VQTLIPFPSIEQLRNAVLLVKLQAWLTGYNSAGEPIYDETRPLPKIAFTGTVKLHGTNMGVAYNAQDGMWVQSRETIIRVGQDRSGFARFAEANADALLKLIERVYDAHGLQPADVTVVIYGEWAGKGIHGVNDVAIGTLEKAFYIFGVMIAKPEDPEFTAYWVDCTGLSDKENRIFNINDYDRYAIEIDFANPDFARARLEEITASVERECPVAKAFGVSGVGEGVVWTGEHGGIVYRFKVKGEKHQIAKTREIAPVDVEKLGSYREFVEYAVTPARLNQAIEKVCGGVDGIDIRQMGAVIRWMIDDVQKEETDTLVANSLSLADVSKYITARTREMYLAAVNAKSG